MGGEAIQANLETCPQFNSKAYEEKLKIAKTKIDQILGIRPKNPEALTLLGIYHGLLCENSLALEKLNLAALQSPNDARPLRCICTILRAEGKMPEALDACNKAVNVDPTDAVGLVNLGSLLQKNNELDKAKECYLNATVLKPSFVAAWRGLGIVHHMNHDYPDAIDCYRKWVMLDPSDAEAHYSLGNALQELEYETSGITAGRLCTYYHLKNHAALTEAVRSLERALQLDPKLAETYPALGIALSDIGKNEKALEVLSAGQSFLEGDSKMSVRIATAIVRFRSGEVTAALADLREMDSSGNSGSRLYPLIKPCIENIEKLPKAARIGG